MKFVLTCGGTAGHINPAIAVAGRLKVLDPGAEFLFIGAEGKMEMELVPRDGYEIRGIRITNISRGRKLKDIKHNLITAKNVIASGIAVRRLLQEFRPDAVIGTGGYVCYPVLSQAHKLGIATFVHESNAVPGLTTKMLAKKVDKVMLGFEESRQYYPKPERTVVTGTPVRGSFDAYTKEIAKQELGIPADLPLVVSVWGSLGAQRMNEIVCAMIPKLGSNCGFQMIHSAGSMYFDRVTAELDETAPNRASQGVDVREYIYDMPRVMAAADLIMCRAGASTLAELCYMGKPVILVPSPNVTNNHQEKNARVLEKAGGAVVYTEKEVDEDILLANVLELLDKREKLEAMQTAMRSLAVTDATDRICGIILEGIRKDS